MQRVKDAVESPSLSTTLLTAVSASICFSCAIIACYETAALMSPRIPA